MSWARRITAMVAPLALVVACGATYLVPAAEARRVHPSSTAIVEERSGIRVVADAQAWTGSPEIMDDLSPIWISVTNRSGASTYLSSTDIRLVGDDGARYAVLPHEIDPSPIRTSVGMDPAEFDDRAGVISDYAHIRSRQARLREEAATAALPSVTLDPGEAVTGFVYFERPTDSGERFDLEIVLRNRPGGTPVATFRLPFRTTS